MEARKRGNKRKANGRSKSRGKSTGILRKKKVLFTTKPQRKPKGRVEYKQKEPETRVVAYKGRSQRQMNMSSTYGNDYKMHMHAMMNVERVMRSYAFQQCYPDQVSSDSATGVPFIAPVPTAKVKIRTRVDQSAHGANATDDLNQFFFSYSPEALLYKSGGPKPDYTPHPFYCGYRQEGENYWIYHDTAAVSMNENAFENNKMVHTKLSQSNKPGYQTDLSFTREDLMEGFDYEDVASMRLVGASINIVQVQASVNQTGSGEAARIYGVPDTEKHASVKKSTIQQSTYRSSVPYFANANTSSQRGIWAPADFTDLHMIDPHWIHKDEHILPVIHGFITGLDQHTRLSLFFDTIIEYVPKPKQKVMVPVEITKISSKQVGDAENAVGQQNDMSAPREESVSSYGEDVGDSDFRTYKRQFNAQLNNLKMGGKSVTYEEDKNAAEISGTAKLAIKSSEPIHKQPAEAHRLRFGDLLEGMSNTLKGIKKAKELYQNLPGMNDGKYYKGDIGGQLSNMLKQYGEQSKKYFRHGGSNKDSNYRKIAEEFYRNFPMNNGGF